MTTKADNKLVITDVLPNVSFVFQYILLPFFFSFVKSYTHVGSLCIFPEMTKVHPILSFWDPK